MAKKINNNLVVIDFNGEKKYYTSMTKAGLKVGLAPASVRWAIGHGNVLTTCDNRNFTMYIVDGSEIPYKLINND